MKRRRAGESADGLALMTSSVTSSYSADGLREQSQESVAISKRCRLHKLIRQRFALALKIQQMLFALINQSQASLTQTQRKDFQTQEDKSIAAEEDSGEAIDKPAGQPDASTAHPVESFFEPAVAMHPVAS
ncbi:hypothetical protein F511_06536 [Dorcoceras hygrometricum]|uniref:Uncharacterized protein n=1 Tax=Dorcoceras hygrometricum TaxID=472368 RepID=A0A2Z7CK38_9LAMI|nr:hypothetical protein F511_06536 [Dorcoceras hygrometricum]